MLKSIKHVGMQLLIANLIAAIILVIANSFMSVNYAMPIAILAVIAYLTFVVIVREEKQTGLVGVAFAFASLLLTITFLSIFVSIVDSLTLSSIWDAFVDTFSGEFIRILLGVAAAGVAIAVPLMKKK